MISLRKKNQVSSSRIIGEVPVTCRGEVVAVAKVEELKSGAKVFHINLSKKPVDILLRGFSLGELPVIEEEEGEV